jgi:hypothetical protein
MLIVGERFRDASFLHDDKGGAISESPGFILPLCIQRKSSFKLLSRLQNNLNVGIVQEASNHFHRSSAERFAKARIVIEKLLTPSGWSQ